MPIYEYICPECANKFEKMRALSQSGQPCECPVCQAEARRQMSVFTAFSTSMGGVAKAVPGTGPSSCSSCSSGSCGTCAS